MCKFNNSLGTFQISPMSFCLIYAKTALFNLFLPEFDKNANNYSNFYIKTKYS